MILIVQVPTKFEPVELVVVEVVEAAAPAAVATEAGELVFRAFNCAL